MTHMAITIEWFTNTASVSHTIIKYSDDDNIWVPKSGNSSSHLLVVILIVTQKQIIIIVGN